MWHWRGAGGDETWAVQDAAPSPVPSTVRLWRQEVILPGQFQVILDGHGPAKVAVQVWDYETGEKLDDIQAHNVFAPTVIETNVRPDKPLRIAWTVQLSATPES